MNAVWVCARCSALHHCGECVCRRCGAPLPLAGDTALVPRGADTEPVLLYLPPVDFPYSRAARPRGRLRSWVAPAVMLGLSVTLAIGWDPFVRRFDAARALGGESSAAMAARRAELGDAVAALGVLLAEGEAALAQPPPEPPAQGAVEAPPATSESGPLPPDWRARVEPLAHRFALDGNAGSATLGPLEVAVRGAWLELVTLPPDAAPAELGARIQSTKEELSRVTSDLSDAR